MKKRITAALLSLAMLLSFTACGEDGNKTDGKDNGKTSSTVSEEEGFSATDAFDLYNEAVVNMAEEEAYDSIIFVDLVTSDDGAATSVEMQYQFKDGGDYCEYYSHTVLAGLMYTYVYYADGKKYDVTKIGADSEPTVTETEMDYETFMADNGNPMIGLLGIDIPIETFEEAEMEEKDGVITVKLLFTDITELPEAMAPYATMFGFNPETATNTVYDDTEITLIYTTEGKFSKIQMESGVTWTKEDGSDGMFDVDLELVVNATGDEVTVNKYTAE